MGLKYREHAGAPWKEVLALNGKSAFESAVDGGYTGTEEAFNIALASIGAIKSENWTFTLEDGTTVTKAVYVK